MRTLLALLIPFCLVAGSAEAQVTLAWDPNTESNLDGYLLSYGTASRQYDRTIYVGNVTTYLFIKPDPTRQYYLALRARNTSGGISAYSNEVVTPSTTTALRLTGLSSNRTSPQPAGTSILFTATATGGTPPYHFKWWIVNGTTATVGQNWSGASTFTWTPTVAGSNYKIRVWARASTSTADAPANSSSVLEMAYAITTATNLPPTVSAGPDLTITLPNTATLNGTATDDGKPVPPGTLTRSWTRVSGPGTVTFGTPSAATTTASFSAAGTYVLRLTASDGALSRSDDVTVTVNAATSAGGNGTGLRGQYFNDPSNGATFFTTLVLTRTDPVVDFDWDQGRIPGNGVHLNNFSIRWIGQVLAPTTGSYTFSTISDDGVRLWINGQLVIDNWTTHSATTNYSPSMTLTKGQRYNIKLEYFERTGSARIELRWSTPGHQPKVIPKSQLFP